MQRGILYPSRKVFVQSSASVVGGHEMKGPLASCFDIHDDKDEFGADTWEKSESEMQRLALNCAISKLGIKDTDIGALFAGDLLNQCAGSNFGLLEFDIPYLGLYGACSTAAEGLVIATLVSGSGYMDRCACVSSSHNCAAERQFRYPIEYGGQRTPTSQWTVTGSGAFIIGKDDIICEGDNQSGAVEISDVMIGRTLDYGITDANNMGAAMAPAAADTLRRYFYESGREPESFGLIVTGDLGFEGSKILRELMKTEGYPIYANHVDCGLLIYNREEQDKHAGGSGCGCSAVTVASYIIDLLRCGKVQDALFVGTGALMSPTSTNQGGSIPGIGHLVHFISHKRDV